MILKTVHNKSLTVRWRQPVYGLLNTQKQLSCFQFFISRRGRIDQLKPILRLRTLPSRLTFDAREAPQVHSPIEIGLQTGMNRKIRMVLP